MHHVFQTLVALQILVVTVSAIAINYTREAEQEEPFFSPIPEETIRELVSQYRERNSEISIEMGGSGMQGNVSEYDTTVNDTVLNSTRTTKQPKCRACQMREEQRKHRLEYIKSRISHVLKLDVLGTPNATRNKLPKVPSLEKIRKRFENQEMMADSPGYIDDKLLYEEEKEEFGQPERTYAYAKQLPSEKTQHFENTIYFDAPLSPEKEAYRALLWIYIDKEDVMYRNKTEINIYSIEPSGKSGGPPFKRQIGYKKKHFIKASGWHHFNIIGELRKWSAREELNIGIVVEALNDEGRNLIVMPSSEAQSEGLAPMLDIRTTLKRFRRRKRQAGLICDNHEEQVACCRYPLLVSFVDFGWDFVIAPVTYQAYYCGGECSGEAVEENLHGHIFNQAPTPPLSSGSMLSNVGPCCTPTHMSDLTMLYFDHEERIMITRLPRMKADRCGCS